MLSFLNSAVDGKVKLNFELFDPATILLELRMTLRILLNNLFFIIKEMSVPLLIGNFKSEADYRRKVIDQNKLIRLQSKLNTEADKASLLQRQTMELGLKPAPAPEVEVSAAIQDYNQQRTMAIASADEVLSKRDATSFVDTYLKTLDNFVMFNRYWDDFKQSIANIRLIDASYMNTLWTKFQKQIYAGTSDVASLTRVQDEVDKIARDILALVEGEANYVAIEKEVMDASRRFDLEALKKLKKKAIGTEQRKEQKEKGEKAIKRIRESRQKAEMIQMQAEDKPKPTSKPKPLRKKKVAQPKMTEALKGKKMTLPRLKAKKAK